MLMNIFLDIETIPGQAPGLRDELAANIRPPGTLKKPESIAAWERDEKPAAVEEAWLNTALDGTYGQVCVIGLAVDDSEPVTFSNEGDLSDGAEAELLLQAFAELSRLNRGTSGTRPVLIGHNLIGFDLPFLWRRAVVRRVRPPFWLPRTPKPWADNVADTMLMWAGDRGTIGLDRLCRALGIPGKDGMTGADVWPAVQAGQIDRVAEYCAADVERTRAVWRRLTWA